MKHSQTPFGLSVLKDSALPSIEELRHKQSFSQEMDRETLVSFLKIRSLMSAILTRQLRQDISSPHSRLQLISPASIISPSKEDSTQYAGSAAFTLASREDLLRLKNREDFKLHVQHHFYQRLQHIQQLAREEIDENIMDMFTCLTAFIATSQSDIDSAKTHINEMLHIAARTAVICVHQGMKPTESQQLMASVIKDAFAGALQLYAYQYPHAMNTERKSDLIKGFFAFLAIEPKETTPSH